ncbi:MAG: hypothetical protein ABIH50_03355 [bacterium]
MTFLDRVAARVSTKNQSQHRGVELVNKYRTPKLREMRAYDVGVALANIDYRLRVVEFGRGYTFTRLYEAIVKLNLGILQETPKKYFYREGVIKRFPEISGFIEELFVQRGKWLDIRPNYEQLVKECEVSEKTKEGLLAELETAAHNTFDVLDRIMEMPDYFDKWKAKNQRAEIPREVADLAVKTQEYRDKQFSTLTPEEQRNIIHLNRLLWEFSCPESCPKNSFVEKALKELGGKVDQLRGLLELGSKAPLSQLGNSVEVFTKKGEKWEVVILKERHLEDILPHGYTGVIGVIKIGRKGSSDLIRINQRDMEKLLKWLEPITDKLGLSLLTLENCNSLDDHSKNCIDQARGHDDLWLPGEEESSYDRWKNGVTRTFMTGINKGAVYFNSMDFYPPEDRGIILIRKKN